MESQASDGGSEGSMLPTNGLSKLMGECPVVEVCMGGVSVPCLVDTGSMVTTVTEGFFKSIFPVFLLSFTEMSLASA